MFDSPAAQSAPPVVVVGTGAAGATAARTLLARDSDVRVVLVGDEPDPPYDRTQLSKAVLTGERTEPAALYADILADDRLTLLTGRRVTRIDRLGRQIALDDGSTQAYRALVLACGAAPRPLPLPGHQLAGIHLVRERRGIAAVADAVRTGGPLVVVGGGLIGLEVAAAARAHGTEVTVLEVSEQLLGRVLPTAVADVVARAHAARDVRLELSTRPVRFLGDGHVTGVELANGRVLPAGVVVVAIGAAPRTDLAAEAGLVVDDGIVVDATLRTEDPAIWAVGDAVRRHDERTDPAGLRTEAWSPAVAMGQHVASGVLGEPAPFMEVPWMWSDQYDLTIQAAGAPVHDLEQVRRGAVEDPTGLAVFGLRNGRVAGVAGIAFGNGIGRIVRGAVPLIQHQTPVTAEELHDPGVDLRKLARERR